MRYRWIGLLGLLLLSGGAEAGRVALVIGNAAYPEAPLATPARDADDLALVLAGAGFSVDKLVDANQQQMEQAIEKFTAKLTEDSVAVFYYSGHALEVQGQNYLLPVGKPINSEANVKYQAVNVGLLLDNLKASRKGLNLVILDACRDNPLPRDSKTARRGLSQATAPSGSLLAYATAPGKVARVGSGRNSIYTTALLKHFKTPDLEVKELLQRVAQDVRQATKDEQQPWFATDYTGKFAFVGDAQDADKLYVAILDLGVQGADPALAKVAKNLLIEALGRTGQFRVFDRSGTLRDIQDEFHLQGSELVDNAVARELKRLHSVEGFVTGELIKVGDEAFIALRLVKTSSEVKAANQTLRGGLGIQVIVQVVPGLVQQLLGAPAPVAPPATYHDPSTGLDFALIPAGCFEMGSPAGEVERKSSEDPQHQVCFKEPFYLGTTEVTQAAWEAVMGSNRSGFKGANRPVEDVSWNDVQTFVQKLNARNPKVQYRLPSEAEWEYACRAGSTTAYHFGNAAGQLGNYAWYEGNNSLQPHPVGEKLPNAWGLYDMHGNVEERVQDRRHDNYQGAPTDGSAWETNGVDSHRMLRGGPWDGKPGRLRSAFRDYQIPESPFHNIGFRLALAARTLL